MRSIAQNRKKQCIVVYAPSVSSELYFLFKSVFSEGSYLSAHLQNRALVYLAMSLFIFLTLTSQII